jgi:hypothetical protein
LFLNIKPNARPDLATGSGSGADAGGSQLHAVVRPSDDVRISFSDIFCDPLALMMESYTRSKTI